MRPAAWRCPGFRADRRYRGGLRAAGCISSDHPIAARTSSGQQCPRCMFRCRGREGRWSRHTPDSHGIESALNGDGLLVARQRPSPTVFTNMTGNGLPFVEDRRSPGASRLGGRRHSVARRPTRSGRPTSFGCHASCPGGAIGSRVTQSQTSQGTINRHRAAARHSAAARCLAWGASTPWKRIRREAGAALARSIAVKIPARSSPAALRFGR